MCVGLKTSCYYSVYDQAVFLGVAFSTPGPRGSNRAVILLLEANSRMGRPYSRSSLTYAASTPGGELLGAPPSLQQPSDSVHALSALVPWLSQLLFAFLKDFSFSLLLNFYLMSVHLFSLPYYQNVLSIWCYCCNHCLSSSFCLIL